jgi:hypothetical protein
MRRFPSGIWPDSQGVPLETTKSSSVALTVAGQWRIYTAFPNILVSLRDGLGAGRESLRRNRRWELVAATGKILTSRFRFKEPTRCTKLRVACP